MEIKKEKIYDCNCQQYNQVQYISKTLLSQMKKQNICFQYQKSDSLSKNLNKQNTHPTIKQTHPNERQLSHMSSKQKQQKESMEFHGTKIINQGQTGTDHYITVQMYKNDKQIQSNRKLSEIIIKNELLSMETNEKVPSFKMKNNIFQRMKRKQKCNVAAETQSKDSQQLAQKRPSFLSHNDLERSSQKYCQGNKKYSNEDNREKSPLKKNFSIATQNEWNMHMNKVDIEADFINPVLAGSRDRSRNLSNFQKLKLQAHQLQKSNILLGTKQQDHFYYVQKTKVHSVANKTLRQKTSIKSYNNASISFSNPQIQNKGQRSRYKYSLTNRKNKVDDKNTIQLDMGDSKQQSSKEDNFGYQFAHKQLNSRSTRRLKTQNQKQRVDGLDMNQSKMNTRQNIVEENSQKQLNQLEQKTIKNLVANFQFSSFQNQDKQLIIKTSSMNFHPQQPTEILKPITASSCNRNIHVSSQPDVYSSQDNMSAQQYVINNEFIPFASRSVIDKNRKNIKKISKNINRILTSKNTTNNLNSCRNEYINSDIYSENKITVGEQLLLNKLSSIELGNKWTDRKNIMNLKSFYEPSVGGNKQAENDSPFQLVKQLNMGREKKSQATSESLISKERYSKIDRSNAQKFYRGQAMKIKDKANRIISDPYLKTKGIIMKKQQDKEEQNNEKNNDILIICL